MVVDEVIVPVNTPAVEPAVVPAEVPASHPEADETTSWIQNAFEPMNFDFDDEVVVDPHPVSEEIPKEEPSALPLATPPPVQTVASPTALPGSTPPVQAVAATPPAQQPAIRSPSAPALAAPVQSAEPSVGNQGGFESLADELLKQRDNFVKVLAEKQYKLTDEDRELFNENPSALIQKVAAQVQVETTASVMRVFAQQLPVVVNGLMQARQKSSESEDRFWAANPSLDKTKHKGVVYEVMKTVRALNPKMDADTFIKTVGGYAALQAGVQPSTPSAAPRAVVSTPGPVVRNVSPAFQAVGAHAAPASSHPTPQKGEWERLAELIHLDNSGAFDT